jgi:hypothetical protein
MLDYLAAQKILYADLKLTRCRDIDHDHQLYQGEVGCWDPRTSR